jgi:WS/DGAT/MGAT family acyltransferase
MVDGIAAVQLGVLLFDLEPEAEDAVAPPWQPQSEASPARVAVESVADLALEQFRAARSIASIGLRPGQAMRRAGSVRRAAFSLAGEIARPAPESFLRAPLSEKRILVPAQFGLERARRIAKSRRATLNDLILAAVARALRELSLGLGAPPLQQRAMVPISVRGEDERDSGGNRITFGFVDLPVDRNDPDECLADVRRQMQKLKKSSYADGTDMLLRTVSLLPGRLKSAVAGVAASPRTYNLTVSNVPGPKVPLYVAGARVRSVHPVIPISEGHVVSVGVVSYEGLLHFGVYADPDGLPEAARLEHLLPEAIAALEAGSELDRTGSPVLAS